MKQPTHPLIQLGPSDDLIATRDLNELEAATLVPFLLERLERLGDMFLWLAVEDLRERLWGDRIGRRKNQRFDDRLHIAQVVTHGVLPIGSLIGVGASTGRALLYTRIGPNDSG